MSRIAYVNGRYLPQSAASVNIEDRGFQFADGVYEVVLLFRGRLIDEDLHLDRLDRSLGELRLRPPLSRRRYAMSCARLPAATGCARGCSTSRSRAAWRGGTTRSRPGRCRRRWS